MRPLLHHRRLRVRLHHRPRCRRTAHPSTSRSSPHPGAAAYEPTYGYYTMGKLMILKLRDDYKAKMGDAYSLKDFHDAFIKLGPLPLPLTRNAMLGDVGSLF